MPLETGTQVQQLNPNWPLGVDPKSQGDDHIRLTKACIQGSFPNMSAAWTTTSQIVAGGYNATDNTIINVGQPVNDTDAARKGDVDALSARVPRFAWGSVGSGGGSVGSPGSGNWTASKIATGTYRIVFDDPAGGGGVLDMGFSALSAAGSVDRVISITATSATEITVYIRDADTSPQLIDTTFTFTRIVA